MLLVRGEQIVVEFMGRDVLDIESLELYDYDRIGLVGANGAGKSTLIKTLLGEISPTEGKVERAGTFAYIPQLEEGAAGDVPDYAVMGKLGVDKVHAAAMSGGEATRLKIAQALSGEVSGIIADEPTCHLDREGIAFLINRLKHYAGALLLVSHDRHLLDNVVDKIWELKDGKITEYWGGYSDYLARKEEERQSQAEQYKQYKAERERLERAIQAKKEQARKLEQKAKGAAAKNNTEDGGRLGHQKSQGSKQKKLHQAARSMEKRIDELGDVAAPSSVRTVQFRQSGVLELHHPYPIVGDRLVKRFGDRDILDEVSFQFPLKGKIALTGGNGSGKSTLLRMIAERAEGVTLSPKAAIGYFDQTGYKLELSGNVLTFVQDECDYSVPEIRAVLAAMGFEPHDVRKELTVLSGGERIKLHLAKLLLGRYNILLLDEPNNYLDIAAVEALETMMRRYAGTIVFVTHDARLIEHVADQVYELKDGTLKRKH